MNKADERYSIEASKEVSIEGYYIVTSIECGSGYNKSFDTGKPINAYVSYADSFDMDSIDEYTVGVDANINGYGMNLELGTDVSLGFHLGEISVDFGSNIKGRKYIQ